MLAFQLHPFHFDGDESATTRYDEIHLRAGLGAQVVELAAAEVLQAFPQLDAHPLLENRAGIRPDGSSLQGQLGSGIAYANVENEKTLRRQQTLAQTARKRRHPKTGEHILQQLVVGFHRRQADPGLARDRRIVDHLAGFGGGQLQEPCEGRPVLDQRLAAQFLFQIDHGVAAQPVGAVSAGGGRDTGQFAECEAFHQVRGREALRRVRLASHLQRRLNPRVAGVRRRAFRQEQRVQMVHEAPSR